jgi:hypothetical protein
LYAPAGSAAAEKVNAFVPARSVTRPIVTALRTVVDRASIRAVLPDVQAASCHVIANVVLVAQSAASRIE